MQALGDVVAIPTSVNKRKDTVLFYNEPDSQVTVDEEFKQLCIEMVDYGTCSRVENSQISTILGIPGRGLSLSSVHHLTPVAFDSDRTS